MNWAHNIIEYVNCSVGAFASTFSHFIGREKYQCKK